MQMPKIIVAIVMFVKILEIHRDGMKFISTPINLQEFDKWVVDFVVPISPIGKRTCTRYIITVTN